jgi:hypothetical protein
VGQPEAFAPRRPNGGCRIRKAAIADDGTMGTFEAGSLRRLIDLSPVPSGGPIVRRRLTTQGGVVQISSALTILLMSSR